MAVLRGSLIRSRPPCTFRIQKREMVGSRTKSLHNTKMFDAPPIRLILSPTIGKKTHGTAVCMYGLRPRMRVQLCCIGASQASVSSGFNARMVRSCARSEVTLGPGGLSIYQPGGVADAVMIMRELFCGGGERDGES